MLIQKKIKIDRLNVIIFLMTVLAPNLFFIPQKFTLFVFILQLGVIFINLRSNTNISKLALKFTLSLLIILIISLCFGLFSINVFKTLKTSTMIIFSMILIIFLYFTDKNREKNLEAGLKYYSYLTVGLCIYGLVIHFLGNSNIQFSQETGIGYQYLNLKVFNIKQLIIGEGISSLTSNPNTLSYMITISLITMYNNFNYLKFKWLNIIVLWTGLLYANSRIALFFSILATCFFLLNKNKKLLLLVIPAGLVLFLYEYINKAPTQVDLNGRDVMWAIGIKKILEENIFTGEGIGMSGQYLALFGDTNLSMHNSYLSLSIDMGLTFVILLIIFFVFLITKAMFLKNKGIVLCFVFLVMASLVETILFSVSSFNYLMVYFMCYILDKLSKNDRSDIYDYNSNTNLQ